MTNELRILMLEDVELDAELVVHELHAAGISFVSLRVDTRASLERALEDFRPDIVLADYSLPGFDGAAAVRYVRERYPSVPVVMVTGALGDEAAVELLRAGARDYVLKDRLARIGPAVRRALAEERDIRARKTAENAVRESEARYRALVETTADWIWEVDERGLFTYASPRLRDLLGFDPAEAIGKSLRNFVSASDQLRAGALVAKSFGDPAPLDSVGFTFVHKDGRRLVFESSATPILDGAGCFRGLRGISRDVTERVRAEETLRLLDAAGAALAESLDFQTTVAKIARLLVPALADMCVVELLDGERLAPVAFAHIDPGGEAVLRELRKRFPADRSSRDLAANAMRSREPAQISNLDEAVLETIAHAPEEQRMLRAIRIRSAVAFPVIARAKLLGAVTLGAETPNRYGPRDLALGQEMVRRIAMAIDSAQLYREATNALHARDEFLLLAAHELRTPLTSMKLQVQMLSRQLQRGADPAALAARTLSASERQLHRLESLAEDLLDATDLHANRVVLSPEPLELGALAGDVVESMRAQLEVASCRVDWDIATPTHGEWDRRRLEQVVANLVSNATKFGAGAPISLKLRADPGFVELEVRDRGRGVAPSDRNRIFDPFERAVPATDFGGLGLGLYISRELVRLHGGTLEVSSAPGEGATFVVRLPVQQAVQSR